MPAAALQPDIALAERLFAALRTRTSQGAGIVRDSYGRGEAIGHEIAAEAASAIGLEIRRDAALNLYMTLPGRDRTAPALLMGSHLDSVPQGGNYDGAAGVVAGLAALSAVKRAGMAPAFDLTVMGIRAEEAAWFDGSYLGSNAAFGRLPPAMLDAVRRSDTKRSLAEHMGDYGADLAALRRGEAYLKPAHLRSFIELHIEQGPVLEGAGVPVGIVTGIRGCRRFRHARCLGAYGHSGAEPSGHRRDAVAATVALVATLQARWEAIEAEGGDLTFTVGELYTDAAMHGPSKIAGETRFVLDFRSIDDATMREMRDLALNRAEELGQRFRVRFDLGEPLYSEAASLDPAMRARFRAIAEGQGIAALEMASGAGHDASVFANLGVPSAMLFVRNINGSHNPDEAMAIEDFAAATQVLLDYLVEEGAR
ncbi:MAG: hydantoinase/carbamoylase family amidase [Alphaproteobacteria bacterium]|nr:hydantoinase/carbamoylase family amidase [Alphaproteobacteria bacterium]